MHHHSRQALRRYRLKDREPFAHTSGYTSIVDFNAADIGDTLRVASSASPVSAAEIKYACATGIRLTMISWSNRCTATARTRYRETLTEVLLAARLEQECIVASR